MARKKKPVFILEIPLIVKLNEDRVLIGQMEAGRRLYNTVLTETLRRHGLLKQSKAWQAARKLPKDTDEEKVLRSDEFRRLSGLAGFTSASITTYARVCKNDAKWAGRLGSNITQALAERVFNAVQQYAFGQKGRPRFKGKNKPIKSLEGKNNLANIIWKDGTASLYIGKITLAAKMPSHDQDPYFNEALKLPTKYCRLVWRMVKGNRRWYVQLIKDGLSPQKHPYVKGDVGLDLGPSTVAVVGENSASLVKLCPNIEHPWKQIRKKQQEMERSRRQTNPECYNANGTWKKGAKFVPSERYKVLRAELAELERKLKAERKRSHGQLANQILALGNNIHSEKLSYIAFQKMFGRSVKVRAPAMLVDMLRRKAARAGGYLFDLITWTLKLSQYDHMTETYTKKPLSERWHKLGDGSGVIQRDIYSAFLAYCVIDNTHHPLHLQNRWTAQRPALLHSGWLCNEPVSIKPSGEITVFVPSELVECN